ncbi:all-trans retinoic acid-induced differentiation factor-like [Brachionichthys hirsutus]|uniref:all-trans retinoic acid-induced differentiation factor-like n=1 Tax=Brachionichthys hirsutus TaxID=412623 RepID=UPI003604DA08
MKAVGSQLKHRVLVLIISFCFNTSHQLTEQQVCELCSGTVLNDTAVGRLCSTSAGRIDRRCCLKSDNKSDPERIIGLDLSNCTLTDVKDLSGASTASMIDLSLNPLVNISDAIFQGFVELNYLILPQDLLCLGGNTSWEKVEVKDGNRICKGQINMCNQTGQLSVTCPENSLCGRYGPGFFECSCADNYHGYKCLREGEFPSLNVFASLGAATVVLTFLLWITQRRKVKPL